MTTTRRDWLAGAAAAAVLAPLPAAAQADPRLADLYARARTEGEVTWYIALITSDQAEQMGQAFTATYPGVKVNIERATGGVIYQKLSQDMRAQVRNCDVFSSSDIGQYVSLGRRNLLLSYDPVAAAELRPIFRNVDKANRFQVESTDFTTLAFHTGKVAAADAPKRWTDLLDPKWQGQVAMAHPAYSGSFATWTFLISKMYGWEFFEKLARNKPLVGRSLVDPVTNIISGERKVGIGPSDLILQQTARGDPVLISYPEDGSVMMIGPVAILRNAPHPNAARLFMEFLLSAQASRFSAEQYRLPVVQSVPPAGDVKTPDAIRIITPVPEELEAGIPAIIEKWRDTFGV